MDSQIADLTDSGENISGMLSKKKSKCDIPDAEKIRKLEAQVFQLKNIIVKLTGQAEAKEGNSNGKKSRKTKDGRIFDYTLYKRRHVLLHVAYCGWNYYGFAVQETTGKTIESELFRALCTTRLIESRETSNYHRYKSWHK